MSLRDIYENGFDEACGNSISADTCPECAGRLRTDAGEISCTACGLIIEEGRLDRGPEWTTFEDAEPTAKRTGAPLTPARHDRGLSTELGFDASDANGNRLSSRKRCQLARLRREQTRARFPSTADRNLADGCSEIARLTGALDLSYSIREEASHIFRRAQTADLLRGRSLETMAAGSVYAACRCRGLTRSVDELATHARCSAHNVHLGYRVLVRELALEPALDGVGRHLPRLLSACDASPDVAARAHRLASLANTQGIANGRKPSGVAAACVYLASQESAAGLTQARLADLAGVSAETLRARLHELDSAEVS